VKTFRDAVIGRDLQIILMGDNAEVGDAAQSGGGIGIVRDVEIVLGVAEFHPSDLSRVSALSSRISPDV
jgi:hypothetical protein